MFRVEELPAQRRCPDGRQPLRVRGVAVSAAGPADIAGSVCRLLVGEGIDGVGGRVGRRGGGGSWPASTQCVSGDPKAALATIDLAESRLRDDPDRSLPGWLDWFTPTRLAAFKGNTQLRAGQTARARDTLTAALDELPPLDSKQRAVMLADLAAVEIAAGNPAEACAHLGHALDRFEQTWYATAMARIRDVRRALHPWQHELCVRELDDRLYGWDATLTAVRS